MPLDITPQTQTFEVLEGAVRYNAWIFQRIGAGVGRRVLEVGCGTGTITKFLTDRELVLGVDISPEFTAAATERYRDRPNVIIRRLDVTASVDELRSYHFDSAVSVNVFEHIPDDLQAMKAVYAVLDDGGTFALLVPGHPVLMSPFDRAVGHCRRYTKTSLRSKLEAARFHVRSIRRSNPVGALGWAVNGLLRRERLGGVGLYDRLVPLLSWIDQRVEPPFGLSLIALATKN